MQRRRQLPRQALEVLGRTYDRNVMWTSSRTNACTIDGDFLEEVQEANHSALGQLVGQRAESVRGNGRPGTCGTTAEFT